MGVDEPADAPGSGASPRPWHSLRPFLADHPGLALIPVALMAISGLYVYSLIDDRPFPAGARVQLVRDEADRQPPMPDDPDCPP